MSYSSVLEHTLNVSVGNGPVSLSWVVFKNRSDKTLVLDRAEVRSQDPAAKILGFRAYRAAEQFNKAWRTWACGFPPPAMVTHPVEGFRISAGDQASLMIGFENPHRVAPVSVRAVRVYYHTADGRKVVYQDTTHRVGVATHTEDKPPCDPTM